jgi:hypothetical protein
LILAGCAGVRQADLESWPGVPVVALDTHSLFNTLHLVRHIGADGIEVRNYQNRQAVFVPVGNIAVARTVGCDNIFYIRDGVVLEYRPEGNCYTDETTRPQKEWQKFVRRR